MWFSYITCNWRLYISWSNKIAFISSYLNKQCKLKQFYYSNTVKPDYEKNTSAEHNKWRCPQNNEMASELEVFSFSSQTDSLWLTIKLQIWCTILVLELLLLVFASVRKLLRLGSPYYGTLRYTTQKWVILLHNDEIFRKIYLL